MVSAEPAIVTSALDMEVKRFSLSQHIIEFLDLVYIYLVFMSALSSVT